MNAKKLLTAGALAAAVIIVLPGCSHKDKMTKAQLQFISHMDQARFFRRQGELKASNQEARSASQLEPHNVGPYLLIIDNLITVGDSTSSSDELQQIGAHLGKDQPAKIKNQLAMDWAKVDLLKHDYGNALKHLSDFTAPKKDAQAAKSEFEALRGRVFLAQDDLKSAGDAFQSATKADPKSVEAKVGLSEVAYKKGDHDQAQSLIAEALKMDKENSQAWLWKAKMSQQDKDFTSAENAYMKALDGIGKYDVMTLEKYQTISSLIDVLRAEGKIQEAYVYEEMLAKSGPGIVKSDFDAAAKAYKEGDLDTAASHLSAILKRAPKNRQAATLLGLIRFQQGQVQEAQKILKSVEGNGQSLEAGKLLAATQIQMGQGEQAQQLLKKLKGGDNDPGVLALVGVAALSSGQADVGRKYIEKSLSLSPDNLRLRLRYARWLMAQNDFSSAAQQAQLGIKAHPDSVQARQIEIQAYLNDKAPKKAYQAVDAWRKDQPKSVAAVVTQGNLEASQHHFDKAFRDYKLGEKLNPHASAVQVALGNLMLIQNEQSKAIPYFEKAVTLAPENPNALRALMGMSGKTDKQLTQTLAFLKKLAKDNPEAQGPRIILLEYALRSGDFKQSEALADTIESLGNKDQRGMEQLMSSVYAHATLGELQHNDPTKAQTIINLALKRFPKNFQLKLINANLLLATHKEDKALKQLRTLKHDHPDSAKPYLVEANYRMNNKQYDQAVELFKLALQKSDSPGNYLHLAQAQFKAGQPEHELDTLEKAAKQYPDAPNIILQLGLSYQSQNKLDKAEDSYLKLLKLSPDQPLALNNLAWIYSEKNDSRAENFAKRAFELAPNSGPIADTYGWTLFKQGKVKESVPVLEKAHKLSPDVQQISLHLAQVYKKDGKLDKAKALLKQF